MVRVRGGGGGGRMEERGRGNNRARGIQGIRGRGSRRGSGTSHSLIAEMRRGLSDLGDLYQQTSHMNRPHTLTTQVSTSASIQHVATANLETAQREAQAAASKARREAQAALAAQEMADLRALERDEALAAARTQPANSYDDGVDGPNNEPLAPLNRPSPVIPMAGNMRDDPWGIEVVQKLTAIEKELRRDRQSRSHRTAVLPQPFPMETLAEFEALMDIDDATYEVLVDYFERIGGDTVNNCTSEFCKRAFSKEENISHHLTKWGSQNKSAWYRSCFYDICYDAISRNRRISKPTILQFDLEMGKAIKALQNRRRSRLKKMIDVVDDDIQDDFQSNESD